MTNEELRAHFDAALKQQTDHFDRKVQEIKREVEDVKIQVAPIVAVYTATTLSGKFTKALLMTLASAGTILLAALTAYSYYIGHK